MLAGSQPPVHKSSSLCGRSARRAESALRGSEPERADRSQGKASSNVCNTRRSKDATRGSWPYYWEQGRYYWLLALLLGARTLLVTKGNNTRSKHAFNRTS